MANDPQLVALGEIDSALLPPQIIQRIFDQTVEGSAVTQLAQRVPLSMSAPTEVPIALDVPIADWIGEGAAKPVDGADVSYKTMTGKKLAVLIPLSEELVRTNPVGILDQIERDLPVALSRGFDYAAIHGRTMKGNAGPFSDYLAKTSQSVTLGTTAGASGGVYIDLVNGEEMVLDNNWDFSGFACDPRIIPTLKKSVDADGRPLFIPAERGDAPSMRGSGSGSLDGFQASYNRGVSGSLRRQSNILTQQLVADLAATGKLLTATEGQFDSSFVGATVTGTGVGVGNTIASVTSATEVVLTNAPTDETDVIVTIKQAADTKLRAIGGDWSRCAYGVGMGVTIKRSTEASYVDSNGVTHSAFQENLVLLLAETYMGFVMADPTEGSFVKYVTS